MARNRRPYNPDTAYGRRKMREESRAIYDQMTPTEKANVDEIGCVIYLVIIGLICLVLFLIGGGSAVLHWLSH